MRIEKKISSSRHFRQYMVVSREQLLFSSQKLNLCLGHAFEIVEPTFMSKKKIIITFVATPFLTQWETRAEGEKTGQKNQGNRLKDDLEIIYGTFVYLLISIYTHTV